MWGCGLVRARSYCVVVGDGGDVVSCSVGVARQHFCDFIEQRACHHVPHTRWFKCGQLAARATFADRLSCYRGLILRLLDTRMWRRSPGTRRNRLRSRPSSSFLLRPARTSCVIPPRIHDTPLRRRASSRLHVAATAPPRKRQAGARPPGRARRLSGHPRAGSFHSRVAHAAGGVRLRCSAGSPSAAPGVTMCARGIGWAEEETRVQGQVVRLVGGIPPQRCDPSGGVAGYQRA